MKPFIELHHCLACYVTDIKRSYSGTRNATIKKISMKYHTKHTKNKKKQNNSMNNMTQNVR